MTKTIRALYQISDGTVSVGGEQILSHIHFEVKGNEKIAVVGRNGAGKTTLLKLIAGQIGLDRDDKREGPGIIASRKITIGMLHQVSEYDQDRTIEEILLEGCPDTDLYSRERFLYEMEYDRIFTGFGFSKADKKKKFSAFSGGEQTKIALIRLLLEKPDLMLLDEPTNHLDIQTINWLENYFQNYEKAVIFVSHDRFFLDQVVDIVYELEDGKLVRYAGNYTAYRQEKKKKLELAWKAYERQQEEIRRLEDLIRQFKNKPKKAAFARSRKTMLDRMERLEQPKEANPSLTSGVIEPEYPGSKWMVEAEDLKIGYKTAAKHVLQEISLRVRRGQKIGIIGDNGVGKTTFLKTLAGLIPPLEGKCTLGNRTLLGYFDQHSAAVSDQIPVVEHFHRMFPAMTEKEVRQILASYLFPGKAAQTMTGSLSGGEKARLILAEMLTGKPNLLLLDEPTNHMDIPAKEVLEQVFSSYTGTILFVSHDRYFIRQVADAILVFEKDRVLYYPFGYEHYLEHSRLGEPDRLPGMLSSQNQALIADMRAVPDREFHQSRPLGTEEAHWDWQLRLAYEELQQAKEQALWLQEKQELLQQEEDLESWMKYIEQQYPEDTELKSVDAKLSSEGQKKLAEDQSEQLRESCEQALTEWTGKCIRWMEIWQESLESWQEHYE